MFLDAFVNEHVLDLLNTLLTDYYGDTHSWEIFSITKSVRGCRITFTTESDNWGIAY